MKLPLIEGDANEHQLERDGWKREFVASEPRLSEMCELFQSMGREVLVTPTIEEVENLDEACKACFESTKEATFTIWTKHKVDDLT